MDPVLYGFFCFNFFNICVTAYFAFILTNVQFIFIFKILTHYIHPVDLITTLCEHRNVAICFVFFFSKNKRPRP